MAGNFNRDPLDYELCEECRKRRPSSDDGEKCSTARYTLRRNMCDDCARGSCADAIVDPSSSAGKWSCNEHPDRDVILFCTECERPLCDKCVHLSHLGHNYRDIKIVVEERLSCAERRRGMISEKSRELAEDRRKIEKSKEDVNQRFDRLQYAVLVRVEEKSRTFDDDHCIAERRVEHRAKEEKMKIDRWKDNRLKELKDEKNAKNRALQQKHHILLRELNGVRSKLLKQLEEYSEGLEAANKIIEEAREVLNERMREAEGSAVIAPEDPSISNARLEECLAAELDVDAVSTVRDIAESVKFEPEATNSAAGEVGISLGKFVMTRPSWCKLHTIQVGLPKFRLLNSTNDDKCVTFSGEHGDRRYGLYTMDISTGNTNLVTSDASSVMDAASHDHGVMAITRSERGTIEIWNTRLGKLKKHIKVPKTWTQTYLAFDRNGSVVARDHRSNGHGKIYVYRSDTGEKVKSVPYGGTIYSLSVLSNGDIVVQSAATEVVIIDQTGAIKQTICDDSWKWMRCTVDRDDNILVAYGRKDDASSIFVDSFSSSDGSVIESVLKHKCNPSLDHIAVVATRSGHVVLQNGGDLLVFDRLIPLPSPSVPEPAVSTPRTQPRVFRRPRPRSVSCSPPSTTRRHHRFMCIPT